MQRMKFMITLQDEFVLTFSAPGKILSFRRTCKSLAHLLEKRQTCARLCKRSLMYKTGCGVDLVAPTLKTIQFFHDCIMACPSLAGLARKRFRVKKGQAASADGSTDRSHQISKLKEVASNSCGSVKDIQDLCRRCKASVRAQANCPSWSVMDICAYFAYISIPTCLCVDILSGIYANIAKGSSGAAEFQCFILDRTETRSVEVRQPNEIVFRFRSRSCGRNSISAIGASDEDLI